jgi:hypothetical protein
VATLIHESPLGDLEIPTVLGTVPPGVPFDVDDDIALSLLTQGDLFHLAAPPKLTELRALAKDAEIDHTGLDRHQLVTALAIAEVDAALTTVPSAAEAAPTEEVSA